VVINNQFADFGMFKIIFVIPRLLPDNVSAAFKLHHIAESSHTEIDVDATSGRANVATISNAVRSFSEKNIQDIAAFYQVKTFHRLYTSDVTWLSDERYDSTNELYRGLYKEVQYFGGEDVNPTRNATLAAFKTSALQSKFSTKSKGRQVEMTLMLKDVIGYLGGTARLSDSVMMYCLKDMASHYCGVYVVDSLAYDLTTGSNSLVLAHQTPVMPLNKMRVILFPIYRNRHWTIICVDITETGVRAALYDPLQTEDHHQHLQRRWDADC